MASSGMVWSTVASQNEDPGFKVITKFEKKKTTFMLFGNCKKDAGAKLLINNVEVEQVSDTKCLGVIIDNNLT